MIGVGVAVGVAVGSGVEGTRVEVAFRSGVVKRTGAVAVSGGGGAPAGYDANVTNVRWTLTGTLAGGDSTADGVAFTVRIIAE